MQYVSGRIALGVPCNRNTCGLWNIPKKEYLDEYPNSMRESEDSPFGDYGIEKNKFVPFHEIAAVAVADHVRVYLDFLNDKNFEALDGLYFEAINSAKDRSDIFMYTFYKLRERDDYKEIHDFMVKEFGNAWLSYLQAIQSVAEHVKDHELSMKELVRAQQIAWAKQNQPRYNDKSVRKLSNLPGAGLVKPVPIKTEIDALFEAEWVPEA